jgi:hypothetical protein
MKNKGGMRGLNSKALRLAVRNKVGTQPNFRKGSTLQ